MQAMGNSQHLDQLMDAQLRDEAKEHSKKLKKFKKVQIHMASLCLWNVVISGLQMQAIPLMSNLPLCVQDSLVWALDMHKNMYHELILSKATLSKIYSFIKCVL